MPNYRVVVKEVYEVTYEVDANSPEDAESCVYENRGVDQIESEFDTFLRGETKVRLIQPSGNPG